MLVRFSRNFDWSPRRFSGAVTLAYSAGSIVSVTRACAAKAIKAGAAVRVDRNGNPVSAEFDNGGNE